MVVLLATTSMSHAIGKVAPRERATVGKTVPVGVYTRVNILSHAGNIIVNGVRGASSINVVATKSVWDRTPGKARAAMAGLTIGYNAVGDMLQIRAEHDDSWSNAYEVEYYLTVPADFRVEATSDHGAIQIRSVRDASATSTNGDVILSDVRSLTAETTGGNVEVDSTSGPIAVKTIGGDIRVRIGGELKAVHLGTSGGSVTLRLPRRVNADLAISTSKGRIATEGLTLSDQTQSLNGVRGTIGEGGTPVEVTTGKGAITVTTRSLGPLTRDLFLRPTATRAPQVRRPAPAPRAPQTITIPPPVDDAEDDVSLDEDEDIGDAADVEAAVEDVDAVVNELDETTESEASTESDETPVEDAGVADDTAVESADAEQSVQETTEVDTEPDTESTEESVDDVEVPAEEASE